MKKEQLPQDESSLKSANMTELVYVTNEDGDYTTANSIGWNAKKLALDESIDLINERIAIAKEKVAKGLQSPIVYYMEFNKMDIAILAAYVGMWQWRVKKHFNPVTFKKLSSQKLAKYATAFDISIEELLNFDGK